MATSSTPVPSAAAIDDAASRRSSRRPLVTSLASRRSMSGSGTVRRTTRSGSPQRLPHALHFAGAADKVGQHEQPDPGPPVVRRHRGQVLQHQPEFGRPVISARTGPAQVIQVEQRVRFASLLEQVGDLLGDRALARPVDPGEQDALRLARIHQPTLDRHPPNPQLARRGKIVRGWRGRVTASPDLRQKRTPAPRAPMHKHTGRPLSCWTVLGRPTKRSPVDNRAPSRYGRQPACRGGRPECRPVACWTG